MSATLLRKPVILPLFNPLTVIAFLALGYLTLTVTLWSLWNQTSGVEYVYYLGLLQAVPIAIAFTRRHFTYLAFVMAFHFVQLTLPKWFLFRENMNLAETFPEILSGTREQIFCTAILILVYYSARYFLFSAVAEKERFQLLTLTRAQVALLSAYVLFVPLLLKHLPSWFLSVHFLLLSADIVLLFTSHSPGNEWLIRVTKVAAIVGAFVYFLNTGMMTLMAALMSLATLVSCLKRQFFLFFFLVFVVLGMSAIQTVKGAFRLIIHNPNETLSTLERAAVLGELLSEKYLNDEDHDWIDTEENKADDIGSNLISGFMRAGDDSLERVLASTPSKVPFWNGETYRNIPYMFIPRMLWPDKPSRHFWNKYGRVYGVLSENDYQTSVGVSYLAEAYMNFGFSGMYFCALLVGFLIASVERSSFFILGGYFYFPYIVLLTPLLAPGSDLGSMLNSLWVIYLVFIFGRPLLLTMAQRDEYS